MSLSKARKKTSASDYYIMYHRMLQWHPAITNLAINEDPDPIGQDRETLTFKALLYSDVAAHA